MITFGAEESVPSLFTECQQDEGVLHLSFIIFPVIGAQGICFPLTGGWANVDGCP